MSSHLLLGGFIAKLEIVEFVGQTEVHLDPVVDVEVGKTAVVQAKTSSPTHIML